MWVLNEILQAWQYIEVYLLALFVASWQLGPVSQYLFNSYCDQLRGFFSQMVYYGILKEEDAQCFGVQGAIEPGSFTLVAAAILLALLNSFVTKATKQYIYYLERGLSNVDADVDDEDDAQNKSKIHDSSKKVATTTSRNKLRPIPVMFTDTYRWLLRRGGEIAILTTVEEVDGIKSIEVGRSSSTADEKEVSFGNSRLSPPSQTRNIRSSIQVEEGEVL